MVELSEKSVFTAIDSYEKGSKVKEQISNGQKDYENYKKKWQIWQ
jgi:hypothetical protein